jgi:hypothetical protein
MLFLRLESISAIEFVLIRQAHSCMSSLHVALCICNRMSSALLCNKMCEGLPGFGVISTFGQH